METKTIITGIDIGTTKVVAVIAESIVNDESNNEEIKIIGIGEHPSHGLKKGIVVDIEETIDIKIQGLKNYRSQEDAQEFAARLSETPDPTEIFAVGPASTQDWESSEVISYLRSL